MSNVYINKSVLMKIESWTRQNRDLDLDAILCEVAISMSISEIEPALNQTKIWSPHK